jgi:hypothetical protein
MGDSDVDDEWLNAAVETTLEQLNHKQARRGIVGWIVSLGNLV